ncbi:transferase [Pseudomonas poae RE*1-1-14]|nr:transferase [Pseudomonas poae RE*1-1-14]MCF5776374.1 transferase [Pseudomonas poae]CRM04441.1 UDP-N-acetylglucosamine diphosphorylase/glucosamine-1-phosphate N-acetyltransferase [Pseudomonas sp. 25 E 4]
MTLFEINAFIEQWPTLGLMPAEAVNIEAGAIIANYRNELNGAQIKIRYLDKVIETGVNTFGALVGDGCKIGANAVIDPGALLRPDTHVPRLGLIDQFAYD